MKTSPTLEAIADAAADWRETDYPARESAVDETLEAPNRWTEPALDHALNRWMQQFTLEALVDWVGSTPSEEQRSVAVVHGEEDPLAGIRDAVAVWALGYEYVGVVPDASPALIPAFAKDVVEAGSTVSVEFGSLDHALEQADAVISGATERREEVEEACDRADVSAQNRLLRSQSFSIGLIDGHESEDEMERMAEDMLLYEGHGRRRCALVWAPQDHPPDALLEAMARFRGLFPAHEDTPGALQMQQAFLDAQDAPHAYADGLEFLMSRGDPEPQKAGHIRWTEYDTLADVDHWWHGHTDDVYAVIARPHLYDHLGSTA